MIAKNLRAFKFCFEKELLKNPGAMGKALVRWAINSDGSVSEVKIVRSDIKGETFQNCLKEAISTLKFPRLGMGRAIIYYPFIFKPSSPKEEGSPPTGRKGSESEKRGLEKFRRKRGDRVPQANGGRMLVFPGQLIFRGALSREQIVRVVKMHLYQIEYCYKEQLRFNPKLEGKMLLRWVINGNGFVQNAIVIDTTMRLMKSYRNLKDCIIERISHWKFPQPAGRGIVVVNYPFVFRSVQ